MLFLIFCWKFGLKKNVTWLMRKTSAKMRQCSKTKPTGLEEQFRLLFWCFWNFELLSAVVKNFSEKFAKFHYPTQYFWDVPFCQLIWCANVMTTMSFESIEAVTWHRGQQLLELAGQQRKKLNSWYEYFKLLWITQKK